MDGATEFTKTTPMLTSSTRYRRGSWRGSRKEDATNVNIIMLDPGGMELAGMPPCAAEDDEDMELARMTSIINIIKLVSRRTEAWNSRDDTTDVYLVKMEPATRSHEDDTRPRCCPQHGARDAKKMALRNDVASPTLTTTWCYLRHEAHEDEA